MPQPTHDRTTSRPASWTPVTVVIMGFPSIRLEGCFPELFGFVFLDPARLDQALGGEAADENLLERFSTTDLGDRVSADGIAIPVLGVEVGVYSVLVRHAAEPSPWPAPRLSSSGWVLGTTTGALLLCGAGYLARWDPGHPRHRRIDVPAGWYAVEIHGHVLDSGADDGAYEFVLTPTNTQPPFRAHLGQDFGLTND